MIMNLPKNIIIVITSFMLFLLITSCAEKNSGTEILVGSKKFTESVILGEIITQVISSEGISVIHKKQLGGTRILWNALVKGEIDLYADYSGTLINEILANNNIQNDEDLLNILNEKGIGISEPLGFNNTYVLGMLKSNATRLNITRISDLKKYPDLRIAFTNEFMDRSDGWPGLKKTYQFPQTDVKGVDHDIAYRALEEGSVDVIDLYSTDAEIKYYDLAVLEDDYNYFPEYKAVILYNLNSVKNNESIIKKIRMLEGEISELEMIAMNAKVKINRSEESTAASEFIEKKFSIKRIIESTGFWSRLSKNSADHITLVIISLLLAIIISIPLGIIAYYHKSIGKIIISTSGIIQTIPSLALLVFMIPLFGIGDLPAIAALFLYSLLPIIRNTYLGLKQIPSHMIESAKVLGLSEKYILGKIFLPLASSSILAGIKTSAVINVGVATLGALIGAGGYGQPILTGIRLDNVELILEGAVPAAILALLVQGSFDYLEKLIVPRGLRLYTSSHQNQ